MTTATSRVMSRPDLLSRRCEACEGGVPKYSPAEAKEQMEAVPQWRLICDGLRIRRDWQAKNFATGVDFIERVAELAEEEDHHPDVHLENYRHVWLELWTHAAGGLTENDFTLAAKIDRIPIEVKR